MEKKAWFDIFFRDENGNEYRDSTRQANFNETRNYTEVCYRGLVGDGKMNQVADNGFGYVGEPVPFRIGKGEHDGDAS